MMRTPEKPFDSRHFIQKFKATIDEYKKRVLAYTAISVAAADDILHTAAINGVFMFLIPVRFGLQTQQLLRRIFRKSIVLHNHNACYIGHAHKIMYMSEEGMVISDAIEKN